MFIYFFVLEALVGINMCTSANEEVWLSVSDSMVVMNIVRAAAVDILHETSLLNKTYRDALLVRTSKGNEHIELCSGIEDRLKAFCKVVSKRCKQLNGQKKREYLAKVSSLKFRLPAAKMATFQPEVIKQEKVDSLQEAKKRDEDIKLLKAKIEHLETAIKAREDECTVLRSTMESLETALDRRSSYLNTGKIIGSGSRKK